MSIFEFTRARGIVRRRCDVGQTRRLSERRAQKGDGGTSGTLIQNEFIFKQYTQIKECELVEYKGHGLGQAGSLIMARSLGGDIQVASRKGEGATFHPTLPLQLKSSGWRLSRSANLEKGI